MKKYVTKAIGVLLVLMIALSIQSQAQVAGEFSSIELVPRQTYIALDASNLDVKQVTQLGLPPNITQNNDLNDGYARIPIGFEFEFNGEAYTHVYVNANGFLTFGKRVGNQYQLPPFTRPNNPTALFTEETSFPINVIAPYWGDHFARIGDSWDFTIYTRSYIRYQTRFIEGEEGPRVFIVEWRNLNVNFLDTDGTPLPANVVSFQALLYENTDEFSNQGNIEFAYGPVKEVDPTINPKTNFRGASVGLKGQGTIIGRDADYLNGLVFVEGDQIWNVHTARTSKKLTSGWPPSQSASQTIDNRILFNAYGRFNVEEWWGDGDVDYSKALGQRHYNLPQGRFVTVNDARLILRAVATETPLDSVRRRSAFHGDVDHSGRFYYNADGERITIPWRSKNYTDDLPDEISSINQIYFEATEKDASIILKYIGGALPSLPWTYDTIPIAGKRLISEGEFEIKMNEAVSVSPNSYLIPVYVNNTFDGNLSARLRVDNANITDVIPNSAYGTNTLTSFGTNVAVYAGYGKYSSFEPFCYIEVETTDSELLFSNVRLNDEPKANISLKLTGNDDNALQITNSPNPVSANTVISFNVNEPGYYKLSVFDMLGNEVVNLVNYELSAGSYNIPWNITDANGAKVQSGVYVYRLTGNNVSISNKLIVD